MWRIHLLIVLFVLVLESYALCNSKELVDLTWHFDNDSIYWPGVQRFEYTKRVENEERGYWYAGGEFCGGEHGGTHMDAPYHFYKDGWKVGHIPVERLIAKGVLLDLQNETNSKGESGNINLEVTHLEKWERQNGPFENGSVLLIKFGRSYHWLNSTKYFEMDLENNLNFPGVSKGAAEWLANSGKFYGVGLDTPSIDPGITTDFMAHRILNGKQIYVLENVKLIEELPGEAPICVPVVTATAVNKAIELQRILTDADSATLLAYALYEIGDRCSVKAMFFLTRYIL